MRRSRSASGTNLAADGIHVACPSLLIGNIVANIQPPAGGKNLVESGKGCKDFNNLF